MTYSLLSMHSWTSVRTGCHFCVVVFVGLFLALSSGCAHNRHSALLTVESEPAGARIWEEDVGDLGKTPLQTRITWKCGYDYGWSGMSGQLCQESTRATLHAELLGYYEEVRSVRLVKDFPAKVFFTLKPIPEQPKDRVFATTLSIDSDPRDAVITIDGRDMGKTPATITIEWSTATRMTKTLVLQKTGYRDATKDVTPQDDKVAVVLQPIKAGER